MSDDRKSSKLPWLLWILTLAAAIGAGYLVMQRFEAMEASQAEAVGAKSSQRKSTDFSLAAMGLIGLMRLMKPIARNGNSHQYKSPTPGAR